MAEETKDSGNATPYAMLFAIVFALVFGFILILGMNFCIQDIDALNNSDDQAYTALWRSVVGDKVTIFFLFITLVAIECRLTS